METNYWFIFFWSILLVSLSKHTFSCVLGIIFLKVSKVVVYTDSAIVFYRKQHTVETRLVRSHIMSTDTKCSTFHHNIVRLSALSISLPPNIFLSVKFLHLQNLFVTNFENLCIFVELYWKIFIDMYSFK